MKAALNTADCSKQEGPKEVYSAFRPSIRALAIVVASITGLMGPFGVNVYMPAIPRITEKLQITPGETLLSVTMYLVFQGISPSFWAPLSDTIGRRPVILCTMVVFLAANLGLSFVNVFWGLLVLRMVQAFGASSTIAIGAGIVSDVASKEQRGRFMSYFQSGSLIGPCIGPIVGGLIAERWEWHSIFFFLAAFTGLILVCLFAILPETLRALVGNGSRRPVGIWKPWLPISLSEEHKDAENQKDKPTTMNIPSRIKLSEIGWHKPWLMFLEPDIALLIVSYSLPFVTFSVASATLSETLAGNYNYNMIYVGLCYLPLGVGFALGSLLSGRLVDWEYRRAKEKYGERLNLFTARLRLAPFFNTIYCGGIICVEWCLEKRVHIAAPMVVLLLGMYSRLIRSHGMFDGAIYGNVGV